MAEPRHGGGQVGLVASLGDQIEEVVGTVQHVEAARITRVGVKDGARRVLAEHADAGSFRGREASQAVVVVRAPLRPLFVTRAFHLLCTQHSSCLAPACAGYFTNAEAT